MYLSETGVIVILSGVITLLCMVIATREIVSFQRIHSLKIDLKEEKKQSRKHAQKAFELHTQLIVEREVQRTFRRKYWTGLDTKTPRSG